MLTYFQIYFLLPCVCVYNLHTHIHIDSIHTYLHSVNAMFAYLYVCTSVCVCVSLCQGSNEKPASHIAFGNKRSRPIKYAILAA